MSHRRERRRPGGPSEPTGRADAEVDRVLDLLRNAIDQQGFTQLEVQAALGWGKSYISQLFTGQKMVRLEQLFQILEVIGVEPADFFADRYGLPQREELIIDVVVAVDRFLRESFSPPTDSPERRPTACGKPNATKKESTPWQ